MDIFLSLCYFVFNETSISSTILFSNFFQIFCVPEIVLCLGYSEINIMHLVVTNQWRKIVASNSNEMKEVEWSALIYVLYWRRNAKGWLAYRQLIMFSQLVLVGSPLESGWPYMSYYYRWEVVGSTVTWAERECQLCPS